MKFDGPFVSVPNLDRSPCVLVEMTPQPPTREERLLACLICLSAIPFPYAGPLVGWIVGRRSPYVRYHAIAMALEEAALTAGSILLILASLCWTVVSLIRTGLDLEHIDWKFMLIKAAAFWLILQALALGNTLAAVVSAVRAYRGRLPRRKGALKRLSARLAGMDPARPGLGG